MQARDNLSLKIDFQKCYSLAALNTPNELKAAYLLVRDRKPPVNFAKFDQYMK